MKSRSGIMSRESKIEDYAIQCKKIEGVLNGCNIMTYLFQWYHISR